MGVAIACVFFGFVAACAVTYLAFEQGYKIGCKEAYITHTQCQKGIDLAKGMVDFTLLNSYNSRLVNKPNDDTYLEQVEPEIPYDLLAAHGVSKIEELPPDVRAVWEKRLNKEV